MPDQPAAAVKTGRRIVWDPEIMARRKAWTALLNKRYRGKKPLTGQFIAQVQAELDALPCPHWDVTETQMPGWWACERCQDLLSAELIPAGVQR